ncbi:hypothetical protein VM1G_02955 [Cytospora mali]|uniref:non-specific serine/threonine protein kinase n=1 Tax=Cytospora mali TaxID=578113 RepID=A0A194VUQ1_CYTMA|nr:hypothetical protein VM1G_02955 [Valsa mali]
MAALPLMTYYDDLEWLQQISQDKFAFYRRGERWDPTARSGPASLINIPIANPDDTNDLARAAAFQTARDARVASGAERYRLRRRGLAAFRDITDQEKKQNINELTGLMWNFQNVLKFSRTLGWGGMSLATLWLWKDPATGRQKRAVLKNALREGDTRRRNRMALNNERLNLRFLARAKHIIQRFKVANFIGAPLAGDIDDRGGVWLEWARRGDLDEVLGKVAEAVRVAQAGERRSTRNWNQDADLLPMLVMWQIFDCLTKACVAMAFPPRLQEVPLQGSQFPEDGDPLPEVIPLFPLAPYNVQYDNIHFDLDPGNVFIDETDNDHQGIALFKVADFGLASTSRETRRVDSAAPPAPDSLPFPDGVSKYIWEVRAKGKHGYYLPEQFTPDWDSVRLWSDPFTDGITDINGNLEHVAANYGAWSNIWQVGQIMWCCITLLNPNRPPIPQPMPTAPGPAASRPRTYGADVLDPIYVNRYGQRMCELVARCLMHKPADRPSLQDLQAELDEIRPPGPITPLTRAWVRKYIRDAPAARARLVDFNFRPEFNAAGARNRLYWLKPRDANDNPTRRFTPFR